MHEPFDDAALTAYALGEVSGPDRARIEALLAASPEMRRELEEIRATAAVLTETLASPAREALGAERRAQIEAEARRAARPARSTPAWLVPALVAAAAVVAVAVVSWQAGRESRRREQHVPPRAVAAAPVPSVSAPSEGGVAPAPLPSWEMATRPDNLAASPSPVAPRPVAPETGAITMTAVDQSGSVLPGAMATIANVTTGRTRFGLTDRRGVVSVPGLPPGRYIATVALAGFKPAITTFDVPPGAVVAGNATLEIAAMAEAVTVPGEGGVVGGVPGGIVGGRLGSIGGQGGDRGQLDSIRTPSAPFTTEAYDHIRDHPFVLVSNDPRSTLSVDVDTASYSVVRRFLRDGSLPPKDAVRIEELLNYFRYDYESPSDNRPFAVHLEAARCPWKPDHRLVRIALKGRELPQGRRPPSNLVFLLDVSGSMDEPNKLPLVKSALRLLVNELGPRDHVAIVVYAGSEGLALPSTPANEKAVILDALDSLSPSGATHGSAGLRLAYETAEASFIDGGVNRVILATDGDFNVGITNQGELVRIIEQKARGGVFLTALGFGMGNLKDSMLEKLADHGNGNYAYIDTLREARKVLVDQIGSTLVTIAKDVKLQIEFNPAAVKAYRLIGYENRVLAHQDFNDDTRDAGDMGAGHTVTALYELVPPGGAVDTPAVDPLRYQAPTRSMTGAKRDELLHVKVRYKEPDGDRSTLVEVPLDDRDLTFEGASLDFRFAAAVASFGMVLRDSPYKGQATVDRTLEWAQSSLGGDEGSLRAEFVTLVEKARALVPRR
jgi:Ca-activated chloride channel family protein